MISCCVIVLEVILTIVYKLSIQDIEEYLVSYKCSFSRIRSKLVLAKIRLSASAFSVCLVKSARKVFINCHTYEIEVSVVVCIILLIKFCNI